MDQENPDFVGWKRTTVKGHFSEGTLEKVSLEDGEVAGPLAGHGKEYLHENGELGLVSIWNA